MKKVLSLLLSLLLLSGILAVPASAAETFVLPKTVRDSYGNEATYQLNGDTLVLSVKANEVYPDNHFESRFLIFPFLSTFSKDDRNAALAVNEENLAITLAQSDLVRSGRIKTIVLDGTTYQYKLKNGRVTKIILNPGQNNSRSVSLKYDNGKYVGYVFDDGYFWYTTLKYDADGLKSGSYNIPHLSYDYSCTLKDGNIYKEAKRGGTEAGPYNEDTVFSFANNQLMTIQRDVDEGTDGSKERTRIFYNPNGTVSSADYHGEGYGYDYIGEKNTGVLLYTEDYYLVFSY